MRLNPDSVLIADITGLLDWFSSPFGMLHVIFNSVHCSCRLISPSHPLLFTILFFDLVESFDRKILNFTLSADLSK